MTAKSRRRKFDKRRKSDEHPQPRRRQEADRPEEGVRVIHNARIHHISFVPEGEGFPGSFVEFTKDFGIAYDERQATIAEAALEGHRVSVFSDHNGYVIHAGDDGESAAEAGTRVHAEIEEAVRTSGAPDFPSIRTERGLDRPEDVLDAILEAKKRWEQPGSAYGTSPYLNR
jgi:hypothetical protein